MLIADIECVWLDTDFVLNGVKLERCQALLILLCEAGNYENAP